MTPLSTFVLVEEELDDEEELSVSEHEASAAPVEQIMTADKKSARNFLLLWLLCFIEPPSVLFFRFKISRGKIPRYTILIQNQFLGKRLCPAKREKV